MMYNIWLIGAVICFSLLMLCYKNNVGVHVEWKINDKDFSNVAAFFVIAMLSILWPITLLLCIIDASNS